MPDSVALFMLILWWNQIRRSGSWCIGNELGFEAHPVLDNSVGWAQL
jgi:hypothetical protein